MNKWHRHNHHTTTSPSTEPDYGHDPIASHIDPFKCDFVIYPDGSTLSARNINVNTLIPFSGWNVVVPYPYTLLVSNLSAISATVNYQNILVSEVSGFVVNGSDASDTFHDIQYPGANNLALNLIPVSSTSWATFDKDLRTGRDLYVNGTAYITGVNITNCLSTDCISPHTAGASIIAHGNVVATGALTAQEIDVKGGYVRFFPNVNPADGNYPQGMYVGYAISTNPLNSANMVVAGSMGLNDGWKIYGNTHDTDNTELIIETGDNRDEPIIFQQVDQLDNKYTIARIDSTGMTVTGHIVASKEFSPFETAFYVQNLSSNAYIGLCMPYDGGTWNLGVQADGTAFFARGSETGDCGIWMISGNQPERQVFINNRGSVPTYGMGLGVSGNIVSTGTVYASCGNSNDWCSTYTTVNTNSAIWAGDTILLESGYIPGGFQGNGTEVDFINERPYNLQINDFRMMLRGLSANFYVGLSTFSPNTTASSTAITGPYIIDKIGKTTLTSPMTIPAAGGRLTMTVTIPSSGYVRSFTFSASTTRV